MRKEKKLGWLMIPGCDGETLTDAYRLLARVYQLMNEYAPVWYSADLRDQLQAALRPPESETADHGFAGTRMAKVPVPKFPARIR